jgi:superfamily I DNA and/or RNA helicase
VRNAKVLVIDEISMVSSNLLDAVNLFLQKNREDERPFGGITVVLVGDLFQLPPIVTSETRPLFEAK